MSLDTDRAKELLKRFDFKTVFIEELGWDYRSAEHSIQSENETLSIKAIAEKRGVQIFVCSPSGNGQIPDYARRRKIDKEITKIAYEHLIIFADEKKTAQVWQWVHRRPGCAAACREYRFDKTHSFESLIQKLAAIAFNLNDEEGLDLSGVTTRLKDALDRDRVTKRFYDQFKKEKETFHKFVSGIKNSSDHDWYASVMLNRLMFVYFIQKKGFLNGNRDYLRNHLKVMQEKYGKDKFYSFYKHFLLRLFHEGLNKKPPRGSELDGLLGNVPYLNGGLFQVHQLEQVYQNINIPDKAFEKVFDFFDQYEWHLDDRPLSEGNEINPDVLGYIFEKYINQKEMGAYYTKEDITEYISKNTIIPLLFDKAKQDCKIAFEGEQSVWKFLGEEPEKYIYPAVGKGSELPLPEEIEVGIKNVSQRTQWNKRALEKYALPTEIWREVVARRQRYEEVKVKILNGEVRSTNDLITYNLNIRQFAQDVIENSEGPELVRAFYKAIKNITVLDPAVGSGAFLFAALNILEPLYEACLDRMQIFLDELPAKASSQKYSDFRHILEQEKKHPNRKYFIYKSIIINNLYGVDIMDEAVEICKLRLFLKLVAQVGDAHQIEPLPDIDFNIRAGNTLVGFAAYEEVKRSVASTFDFDNAMGKIETKAQDIDQLFILFRQQQTELGGEIKAEDKQKLQKRLGELEEELNHYLAGEYGVDYKKNKKYQQWLTSHKPFHWFVEFYGIMNNGGFDVVIGNPPYVEYSKVKKDYTVREYQTEKCGNLYAFVMERCFHLLGNNGRKGMIVPHSSICTDRMGPLLSVFLKNACLAWFSTYCIRPAKLFVGVDQRLAIYLVQRGATSSSVIYSSKYHHWHEEFRVYLLPLVQYTNVSEMHFPNSIPKIHQIIEGNLWNRLTQSCQLNKHLDRKPPTQKVYFHNAPRYWIRAMDFAPYFWNERNGEQISTQVKSLQLATNLEASVVVSVLNSSLFYWWFVILSDCRHLNLREIENFPVGLEQMSEGVKGKLLELSGKLMADLKRHAQRKECYYQTTGKVIYDEFYPKHSKPIIDEIDRILAKHYGFTDEELDFITNYDIKYRMGKEQSEEDES